MTPEEQEVINTAERVVDEMEQLGMPINRMSATVRAMVEAIQSFRDSQVIAPQDAEPGMMFRFSGKCGRQFHTQTYIVVGTPSRDRIFWMHAGRSDQSTIYTFLDTDRLDVISEDWDQAHAA